MNTQSAPTAPYRYGVFLAFLFFSFAALIWFGWSFSNLVLQLSAATPVISLNKGAMYMLGIGLASSVLTIAIFQEAIIRRPMTDKLARRLTGGALAGLVIVFLLPFMTHSVIEQRLEARGYKICEQASYQWLLYRNIVYVSDYELCTTRNRR